MAPMPASQGGWWARSQSIPIPLEVVCAGRRAAIRCSTDAEAFAPEANTASSTLSTLHPSRRHRWSVHSAPATAVAQRMAEPDGAY
jgi:hypothetical protein